MFYHLKIKVFFLLPFTKVSELSILSQKVSKIRGWMEGVGSDGGQRAGGCREGWRAGGL